MCWVTARGVTCFMAFRRFVATKSRLDTVKYELA